MRYRTYAYSSVSVYVDDELSKRAAPPPPPVRIRVSIAQFGGVHERAFSIRLRDDDGDANDGRLAVHTRAP